MKEFGETSPQDCSSYDEETLRWQLSPSALCFLWLLPKVSPCAGIPLSVILFSPRSLLPGQMHTNAFRSSTDKEWTRFRGSNVELSPAPVSMLSSTLWRRLRSSRSGYPLSIGAYNSKPHRRYLRKDKLTASHLCKCSLTFRWPLFWIWGVARLKLPL